MTDEEGKPTGRVVKSGLRKDVNDVKSRFYTEYISYTKVTNLIKKPSSIFSWVCSHTKYLHTPGVNHTYTQPTIHP